jgi:hypothetical protein
LRIMGAHRIGVGPWWRKGLWQEQSARAVPGVRDDPDGWQIDGEEGPVTMESAIV